MIARIKAVIAKVAARHDVRSAVRHASTAFIGVLVAAVAVGGVHALTVGLVVAAAAAAVRVIELAVVAHFTKASA